MLRRLLPALAFLAATTVSRGARADNASDHRYQTWFAGFVHGSLYKSLWLWTDVHIRLYENFEPSALLLRPALSWKARVPLWLTGGYGWTPSWQRPDGELRFTDEHRAWEQILWAPRDEESGVAAMVRGRLEQRFRPADGDDVGFRFRFFWRGQVPLSRDGRVIFAMWDEVFVGLHETDWGQRPGIDQNRVFVGIGWQAKTPNDTGPAARMSTRLELGYTNVWLNRPGPDPVNHIIALNTFWGWAPRG